jgi:hypothetical protein
MTPGPLMVDNRKYLWDGAAYADEAEARRAADGYRESRFEIQIVPGDGGWLVFTRREAAGDSMGR